MKRTKYLLMSAAIALTACSSTRLAPAIKAYGESVAVSAGAIGDNATRLRGALRHQQLAVWRASDLNPVARQSLVCTPISYAFRPVQAQAALTGVGERLGEVASESPDTLIGLAYALRDDYSAQLEGREEGEEDRAAAYAREQAQAERARSRLDDACALVLADTFAAQADTQARMQRLRPVSSGTGAPSISATIELLSTIRGIFIRIGQMVDQERRNEALRRYFSHEDITRELYEAQRRLDVSVRITELGSRLAAQRRYASAWSEYRAALTADATPNRRGQEALLELIGASADLDAAVAGRARDRAIETLEGDAARNNKRCVNDPEPVEPQNNEPIPAGTCWYSAVGLNVHAATDRLRSAVLMRDDMTDEDREALALAIGAVINSTGELATELEGLEDD